MHKSQSHHSHFGGNGLGIVPSRVHSGSKVPSDVLPCRCFYKLLCCSLGAERFPFLAGRETQLVPPMHRREKHNTKGSETIESRAKEAWFPMDLCLASWADSDPSCSHLLPLLTAPPHFPSPPSISLGICLCMSAKQSLFQVRDPGYSTVWKSKSSSCLQDTQQACSSLCTCAVGHPTGQARTASTSLQLPKMGIWGIPPPSHRVLHTDTPPQIHLKAGTEIEPSVGSSQLLDTNGCWVGKINQLCFHSETLVISLAGNGQKSGCHTWGNQPHTQTSLNLPDGGVLTHSLPTEYEMKINPWQGAHGVASAPLVTQAQTKSSDLQLPRFLPCPWDSQCSSPFHRAAVMVVNLMPLKHSHASTHARARTEAASQ